MGHHNYSYGYLGDNGSPIDWKKIGQNVIWGMASIVLFVGALCLEDFACHSNKKRKII